MSFTKGSMFVSLKFILARAFKVQIFLGFIVCARLLMLPPCRPQTSWAEVAITFLAKGKGKPNARITKGEWHNVLISKNITDP